MATQEQLDLRKKWVEALRSGKYTQTQGTLHSREDGGFCCLGVLCDVLDLPQNNKEVSRHTYYYDPAWGVENDSAAILPKGIKEKVGLSANNGGSSQGVALSDMNDRGTSFDKIADFIESVPPGLFVD